MEADVGENKLDLRWIAWNSVSSYLSVARGSALRPTSFPQGFSKLQGKNLGAKLAEFQLGSRLFTLASSFSVASEARVHTCWRGGGGYELDLAVWKNISVPIPRLKLKKKRNKQIQQYGTPLKLLHIKIFVFLHCINIQISIFNARYIVWPCSIPRENYACVQLRTWHWFLHNY